MTTSSAPLLVLIPMVALLGFGDASGNMAGVLFWTLLMVLAMSGALVAIGVWLPNDKRAPRLTPRIGEDGR